VFHGREYSPGMAFIASIFTPIPRAKNIFAFSSKYRGIVLSDWGQVAYSKTSQQINRPKRNFVVMAGSINKVILVGNLGRDPEVRATQDGSKIVNLSLATSERWKDRNTGEQRERTEWHRVVIFNENLGRIAEQYLRKGSTCYIEGQLQTRKWTDQQGAEKYTTEVVLQRYRGELTLLGGRGDSAMGDGGFGGDQDSYASQSSDSARSYGGSTPPPMRDASDLDDDIPF
jgi:single-strand DNA-binding protein